MSVATRGRAVMTALALAGLSVAMSGCVAAVVPVLAGAAIGRKPAMKLIKGDKRESSAPRAVAVAPAPAPAPASATAVGAAPAAMRVLPAGSALPPPDGSTPGMRVAGTSATAVQAPDSWRALVRHVAEAALTPPAESVVLAPGATIDAPVWVPCEGRPLAALIDMDAAAGSDSRHVAAEALRTMGVAVVAIDTTAAGDAQRRSLAKRYCVVAIAGDAPRDFTPLVANAAPGSWGALEPRRGAGWFLVEATGSKQ